MTYTAHYMYWDERCYSQHKYRVWEKQELQTIFDQNIGITVRNFVLFVSIYPLFLTQIVQWEEQLYR